MKEKKYLDDCPVRELCRVAARDSGTSWGGETNVSALARKLCVTRRAIQKARQKGGFSIRMARMVIKHYPEYPIEYLLGLKKEQ